MFYKILCFMFINFDSQYTTSILITIEYYSIVFRPFCHHLFNIYIKLYYIYYLYNYLIILIIFKF